ncbi:MAG: putative baseplate assembly protein, partial [Planctomycetota bacterium]
DANGNGWWNPKTTTTPGDGFEFIRQTVVYAQSELLPLAEEPMTRPLGLDDEFGTEGGNGVQPDSDGKKSTQEGPKEIELDGLYDGLQAGRSLLVAGERTDLAGVKATEHAVLSGVKQMLQPDLPNDTPHTRLVLAKNLSFSYKRDSVVIRGNVARATHGETRSEVLGSGDANQAFQQFPLSSSPLTHLAAPTAAGTESTLVVRVNEVKWHEAGSITQIGPNDRSFITKTNGEQQTTVIFGNGKHGARLPSGVENVSAVYRTGIGKPGNVMAEQISQLASQPLGVKGVSNPLPATGGADREARDGARGNAPVAVTALDRLVSVQDYADFALNFAGIGKACAARLTDGRRELIHVTIAGAEDIPIERQCELYRNLLLAMHRAGDPHRIIQLHVRELLLLLINARIAVLPDHQWPTVERDIRVVLLEEFGFDGRALGQDVTLGEVITVAQQVPGVAYVDADILHNVPETITPEELSTLALGLRKDRDRGIQPRKRIAVNLAGDKFHKVKKEEEDLADVAEIYKTDLDELRRLNPGIPDVLKQTHHRVLVSRTWPAQLAYLSPDVPDTLILSEITA